MWIWNRSIAPWIAGGLLIGLGACTFSSKLTLKHSTTKPLVPYLVATDLPPPYREAMSAATIPIGGTFEIDAQGFNPVFFAEGITDLTKANGSAAVLGRCLLHPEERHGE